MCCRCVWVCLCVCVDFLCKQNLPYSNIKTLPSILRASWIQRYTTYMNTLRLRQFICNIFVEVIVQPLHTTHLNTVYLHFLVQSIALYPTIYVVWCSCVRNPHFIFSFSSFCIVIWNEVRIWSAQKINLKRKSIDQKWRARLRERKWKKRRAWIWNEHPIECSMDK